MKYRHIILTRFNLQFDLQSDIHLQKEWLSERMRLFTRYCLPSLQQQSNHHFTWVLLVSDQTPKDVQQTLLNYAEKFNYIEIHFCAYTNNLNALYKEIGMRYVQGYDYLLSTRMDNDDMLANNFCEALQNAILSAPTERIIYTFPNGTQWFETQNLIYGIRYSKNHFLSFFEPASDIKTCLGFDHTQVPAQQTIELEGKAMWCEIVHHTNICNNYNPTFRYRLLLNDLSYPIMWENCNREWLSKCLFLIKEYGRYRYAQCQRLLKKLFRNHIF